MGAWVTGAGAAAVVAVVALILAAGDFLQWYFGYLLKWYPRRGTKVVVYPTGWWYAWHQAAGRILGRVAGRCSARGRCVIGAGAGTRQLRRQMRCGR